MQAIASAAFGVDGFDAAAAHRAALPVQTGPRPKAVLARLQSGFVLNPAKLGEYEANLKWLFDTRNATVHADVRVDPTWTHPSGISVGAIARDLGLESAERALSIMNEVISGCLAAPRPGVGLDEWVAERVVRMEMAIQADRVSQGHQ